MFAMIVVVMPTLLLDLVQMKAVGDFGGITNLKTDKFDILFLFE